MEKDRFIPFDILRIIACFSVIMLHCSAQFWYTLPVNDSNWLIENSYDAVSRFGVPIFIMISGALFLSRGEISIKKLYVHNILRILVAYIAWTLLYAFFRCRLFPADAFSLKALWVQCLSSHYHLWFLPMIAGIYMLLPILKKWIDHASKREVEYFLLLFMILKIGRETLQAAIQRPIVSFVNGMVSIDMVSGYLGYFILGYYLYHFGIEQKWQKWIYVSGILGAVFNVLASNYLSLRANTTRSEIYDSFTIGTFAMVIALFLFTLNVLGNHRYGNRAQKIIRELSASTFGIYLIHIAIIDILNDYGIHSMSIHPIFGIPVLALSCFVIGYVIIAIIRRIPLLKKIV